MILPFYTIFVVPLIFCFYFLKGKTHFLFSLTLGIITVLVSKVMLPDFEQLRSGRVFLVRVESVAHKRPGEVSLDLKFLGALGIEKQNIEIFNRGPKLKCKAVMLPWKNIHSVESNDIIFVHARISEVKHDSPFSFSGYLTRHGYSGSCKVTYASKPIKNGSSFFDRLRADIKESVYRILGKTEQSGLLLSMSVGTRNVLTVNTERVFQSLGLTHLLVVSGYQISLIFYSVFVIANYILLRIPNLALFVSVKNISMLLGLVISSFFVLLVGVDGSSLRAGIAITLTVIGNLFERDASFVQSIFLSLLILIMIWPGAFLEPGVQLSYAALAGIAVGSSGVSGQFIEYLKVCMCASLFSSVVSYFWFENFTLMTFIANPLLAPLLSFIGCKLVFIGLLLHLSAIDQPGYLLQLIYWFLGQVRDLAWWATGAS